MVDPDGDLFDTDSPGEAARQFRYALGAVLVSLVVWSALFAAYDRTTYFETLPGWTILAGLVAGVLLQALVLVAFTRCAVEYGTWIDDRIELFG